MTLEYLKTYRELVFVYVRLISNIRNLTSLYVYELYREYLKLCVKLGTNKPLFDEKEGKYNHSNCYMYALGLITPEIFASVYEYKEIDNLTHNLGFMTDDLYSSNDLNTNLYDLQKDLELLGIDSYECTMLGDTHHGGYKIAFFKAPFDFHFIRQNMDGTWSHKLGYSPIIERVEMPQERVLGRYNYIKTLEIVKPIIEK